MIYGRFGHKLTIERMAVIGDVKRFTGWRPCQRDREAIGNGLYVVVKRIDDGKQDLYHLAFLKADGGLGEIQDAIEAIKALAEGVKS